MRVLLVANTGWYLFNYRLALANALRQRGDEVACMASPDSYLNELEKLGFACYEWPLTRQVSGPRAALAEIGGLRRTLQDYRPELVHFFTAKPISHGGVALRTLGRPCAVINAPAGLGPAFTSSTLRARCARQVLILAYRLALQGPGVANILQNDDDVRDLQRWGALRTVNYHVIRGSGVSIQRFQPAPVANRARMRVVMATRINAFKGVRDFAEAGRLLRARGAAVDLVLAGTRDEGHFGGIPDAELAHWDRSGWLHYVGHHDRVEEVLRDADVVALPTINREGVPRILIEGAALGKPLVATDVVGCRDIVRHGKTGLLVPPRDAVALADALLRLAADPALRARLGAAGRELVEREFEETMVVTQTLAAYTVALDEFARSRTSRVAPSRTSTPADDCRSH